MKELDSINVDKLYEDVSNLIETAKSSVAIRVNKEFVILNWRIGNRIRNELLNNQKPEYGKQVIEKLSKRLIQKYGRGYKNNRPRKAAARHLP